MSSYFLDSYWFLSLYFILLLATVIAGYLTARSLYVKRSRQWVASGVESSIIGFFALVLSFTLSSSYEASRTRNSLIHQQSDAIAQMQRESVMHGEQLQSKIKDYLSGHIDAQLSFYRHQIPDADSLIHLVTAQNEQFLTSVRSDSAFPKLSAAYNALSSASFKMLYSFDERTPKSILLLLIFSSLLIGVLVGFMNGFHKTFHILVPLLFIVLTFFTTKTILDLDNPLSGNVRPEYKNLQDLQAVLKR